MRTRQQAPDDPPLDYVARVNRAIDHVVANLDGDCSLAAVARAAHFSPFHFHRVFQSLVGETLARFVKRLQLERALALMSHAPRRPLTEVALAAGFASSSDFSRAFKQRFGVSPRGFDLAAYREARRTEFEQAHVDANGVPRFTALPPGTNPDGFVVALRDLPPRTVAYVRVLDPFRSPDLVTEAYEELRQWAEPRGFADRQWLGYMWEEPELVPMAQCRYDTALEVDDVRPHGRIGRFDFPAMRIAEVRIAGDLALEVRALDWLFGTWLPRSGYEPDEQPVFEAWLGRPFAHGNEHFTLACQLPVRRSRG